MTDAHTTNPEPTPSELADLAPWEQHIWRTPGLTVEERQSAILLVRLQRGDLQDDTGGLLRLYHSIGRAVKGKMRP